MKKKALSMDVTGQDGFYLAEHLLGLGYDVWRLIRRTSLEPMLRLGEIVKREEFHTVYGDLCDSGTLRFTLEESKPDDAI